MKSNEHKKRTFEDKFARQCYCKHARLNYLRSDKKQCRRKERHYGKSLCKESEDTMAKIDWYYAAVRIAKIYATQWECSMYDGEEDDFIVCPECEEPIYLDDYPEFDGAADKSFCICPICEQRLDQV